ncbi:MAG: methyltransferase domain-containing protein [bacterium]|nr:methyltransferase domain-containing protein [bacterium]
MKKNTSWGKESVWGSYQKEVILPNLLRLLKLKKNEVILDLACGAGFFVKEFSKTGARAIGADISRALISAAKNNSSADFYVSPADDLRFLKDKSVDKITLIFAIQNIENVAGSLKEANRVLKPQGKLFIVMNHPAFRIPQESSWGWDSEAGVQYRRIDRYLSESKAKIEMHPSATRLESNPGPAGYTISFHRPLQFYFKALEKNGFSVIRLEEWVSNKTSGPGLRAAAENRSRSEIPLFLFLETGKFPQ